MTDLYEFLGCVGAGLLIGLAFCLLMEFARRKGHANLEIELEARALVRQREIYFLKARKPAQGNP